METLLFPAPVYPAADHDYEPTDADLAEYAEWSEWLDAECPPDAPTDREWRDYYETEVAPFLDLGQVADYCLLPGDDDGRGGFDPATGFPFEACY